MRIYNICSFIADLILPGCLSPETDYSSQLSELELGFGPTAGRFDYPGSSLAPPLRPALKATKRKRDAYEDEDEDKDDKEPSAKAVKRVRFNVPEKDNTGDNNTVRKDRASTRKSFTRKRRGGCDQSPWHVESPMWPDACRYRLEDFTEVYGKETLQRSAAEAYEEFRLREKMEVQQPQEPIIADDCVDRMAPYHISLGEPASPWHPNARNLIVHSDDRTYTQHKRPSTRTTKREKTLRFFAASPEPPEVNANKDDAAYLAACAWQGKISTAKVYNLASREVYPPVVYGTPKFAAYHTRGSLKKRKTSRQVEAADHLRRTRKRIRHEGQGTQRIPPLHQEQPLWVPYTKKWDPNPEAPDTDGQFVTRTSNYVQHAQPYPAYPTYTQHTHYTPPLAPPGGTR